MQTWARRGLRTALVTGGLLMLGTGIASAGENVHPDRPASPIDGGISVPVHVGGNAVGTPLGQFRPAGVDRTISTPDLTTGARPISTPAAGVTPVSTVSGDPLRGNRARADVVAPVDVSGNAVAAGGDATAANSSDQETGRTGPVLAGWDGGPLTGNVVEAHHAVPVQVTGNAVGAGAGATSVNDARQAATTGGDTTTGGARRTLAGNVLAEQGATPVQADGNAVAAGGRAQTQSTTASAADSAGTIATSGANGTGSGNVGAVPLAVPLEITHHAVSGAGSANSAGQNTVTAKGGDNTPGYVTTNGDPSTLSGNAAVPGMANPVAAACDAAGAIGNSDAECATVDDTSAGGIIDTTGAGSTGSGNLAQIPVTEPTEFFGNGASAIGNANSGASDTDTATALGNGGTTGDGSALSGNTATTPLAGANDCYANGASVIGNAAGTAGDTVRSTAGGDNGTTGTGTAGSGDIAQLPLALPAAADGTAASVAGTSAGTLPAEERTIRAGGSPTSTGDHGIASGDIASAPTALPAQLAGTAAGAAAQTGSVADNTSTTRAGGDPTATGTAGTGSGNIVQLPTATPSQAFNDGASLAGNGVTTGGNDTTAGSGGQAAANGADGTIAGNVVNLPDAGPIQAFGVAAASPGTEEADSLNNTYTEAGGNTLANGDRGALAGDVVTAQGTPVEQLLTTGIAGAGNSTANGLDDTATTSGGDVRTSGEWGALSGDLVNVPAAAVTRAPANGAAALANQWAFADTTASAVPGGTSRTAGHGLLDGTPVVVPAGTDSTVFRVPVDILGHAIERGHTVVSDGDTEPRLTMPVGAFADQEQFGPSDQVDRLLGANQVPGLFGVTGGPVGLLDVQHTQVLPAITDSLPATQVFPAITDDMVPPARQPMRPQAVPTRQQPMRPQAMPMRPQAMPAPAPYLPMTGELPVGGALPGGPPVSANLPTVTNASAPFLHTPPTVQSGRSTLPNLPALPDLPPVPTLPAMPPLPGRPTTQDLPTAPALPSPTFTPPHLNTPSVPTVPMPHVSGPLAGGITGQPTTQDVPAGQAQQLMAQLRGLINELENSHQPHPMFDDNL